MNSGDISDWLLLEKIWEDADFKPKEKIIKQPEINKIRQIKYNFYVSKCKICNLEIKLPCTYNGNYPLCEKHRNPNDRI